MRNLKLLEKCQPSPPSPRHQKKRGKSQTTRKRKIITPRKISTTLKLPQPLEKSLKPPPPHLKNSQFLKKP